MDCNQVFVVFLLCLLFDHRIRLLWDDDGRPYGQWTTRNHCCNFLLFCLQPLRRVHDSTTGRYLATNPWSRVFFFFFEIFWPQKYFKFSNPQKIEIFFKITIVNFLKNLINFNPPNFSQFFCQKSDENFHCPWFNSHAQNSLLVMLFCSLSCVFVILLDWCYDLAVKSIAMKKLFPCNFKFFQRDKNNNNNNIKKSNIYIFLSQ